MRCKDLEKQQRIKTAMVHLFLREGIDGTSISKIAKEAGVSPATIYVYYNSKEDMLAEVFREYSRQSYQYLMRRVHPEMDCEELIETIVRSYYAFSTDHEEIFSFVEQCSRCTTLSSQVSEEECCCEVFDLIHAYQAKGLMRTCSDWNIGALLFAPVRFLAMNRRCIGTEEAQLNELVQILQKLLLL